MDEKKIMLDYRRRVESTVRDIKWNLELAGYADFVPEVAIILGSGLGCFAESSEIEKLVEIPYENLPFFPKPTTEGHKGRLIFGAAGTLPIMIVDGRRHCYEFTNLNEGMKEVALPVRVMKGLGVESLITTNAAGGLNPKMNPGDLMIVNSVMNYMGTNPLVGYNDEMLGIRFPPLNDLCDEELRKGFMEAFSDVRYAMYVKSNENEFLPNLHEGYCATNLGPNYETSAEVQKCRNDKMQTVGMSLVPELWAAKHGHFELKPENKGLDRILRTLAINAITNVTTATGENKTSHEEVIEAGKKMEEYFPKMMVEFLELYSIR